MRFEFFLFVLQLLDLRWTYLQSKSNFLLFQNKVPRCNLQFILWVLWCMLWKKCNKCSNIEGRFLMFMTRIMNGLIFQQNFATYDVWRLTRWEKKPLYKAIDVRLDLIFASAVQIFPILTSPNRHRNSWCGSCPSPFSGGEWMVRPRIDWPAMLFVLSSERGDDCCNGLPWFITYSNAIDSIQLCTL